MAEPGLIVAPLTPFTAALAVDEKSLERQIDYVIASSRPMIDADAASHDRARRIGRDDADAGVGDRAPHHRCLRREGLCARPVQTPQADHCL
jgi:hypothetical protein